MRVLLMGEGDLAEEVDEALEAGGADVRFLVDPDDESVRAALDDDRPDVVCVAARRDAFPVRMALLVRHYDADVPLIVTIFDPAMARQIAESIPHCTVTSVADIVAPILAGPCLDPDLVSIRRDGDRLVGLDASLEEVSIPTFRARAACAATPRRSSPPTTAARRCSSTARSGSSTMLAVRVGRAR